MVTCLAADAPKGTRLEFEVSGKLKSTSLIAAQKGTTVIVENLFKTLPVRRRELERTIKREWNRVVGVLGQYACIQTGVKLSVTQQHPKGKKTILFSTKGNRSTRENIANIFGAKTLASLVPLDLKLDLDRTDGAAQRPKAELDVDKKDIRLTGHVSRPNYGEGRQTPDRQMFFVNGRPCGLPQFAKAFNEVYKSYNTHQSPFIFANIELDTHLYDVNVSPDKRTILLHDQSRMLESLKTALVELFESQEYTIPVSQIPSKNLPTYKQLTINQEKIQDVKQGQESTESEEEIDVDGGSDLRAASGTSASQSLRESPISNFRRVSEIPEYNPKLAGKLAIGVKRTAPTEELVEEEDVPATTQEIQTLEESDNGSTSTDQDLRDSGHREQSEDLDIMRAIPESHPLIQSAISSTPRSSQSIAETFSKRSPYRNAPDVATIHIGDHVVTSPIGGPPAKRKRTDAGSPLKRDSNQTSSSSLPSFRGRLSQRFAAPGAVAFEASKGSEEESEGEDAENEEDEDEDEDDDDDEGNIDNGEKEVELPSVELGQEDHKDQEAGDAEASVSDDDGDLFIKDTVTENIKTSKLDEPDENVASDNNLEDDEYIDEDDKKAKEDAKVLEMIKTVEEESARPPQENATRAKGLLKGGVRKKDSTVSLVRTLRTSVAAISDQSHTLHDKLTRSGENVSDQAENRTFEPTASEEMLSLTVSKNDFAKMKIIGQFNLGFIITSRSPESSSGSASKSANDLFIIDQHASDEKYNFERLQATTLVQSQSLVHPKTLDLTALEEEIIMENLSVLESNGFVVRVDTSGDYPVGRRCQLVGLPLSRETTFTIRDLEELIALLADSTAGTIPRPSKVRKMLAMRACRSSIMIGKTLTSPQMEKVVKHMGELDKPWNCPHGRPTMRHLCGLSAWDEVGWREDTEIMDLAGYVRRSG